MCHKDQCPVCSGLYPPVSVSGRWSGALPQCHTVQCPLLTLADPHVLLTSVNLTSGSRAVFRCPAGHRLVGQRVLRCRQGGSWSGTPPVCQGEAVADTYRLTQSSGVMLYICARMMSTLFFLGALLMPCGQHFVRH